VTRIGPEDPSLLCGQKAFMDRKLSGGIETV
jgi:hypothetical protein